VKILFTPIGILAGLAAGFAAQKGFDDRDLAGRRRDDFLTKEKQWVIKWNVLRTTTG
jgi:hypothetical protein